MHCGVDLYPNSLLTLFFFFSVFVFFVEQKLLNQVDEKFGKLHILAFGKNDFLLFCMNLYIFELNLPQTQGLLQKQLCQVACLDLSHLGLSLQPIFRPFANTPSYTNKQCIHLCLHSGDNTTGQMPQYCQTPDKIAVSFTEALPATPKESNAYSQSRLKKICILSHSQV